MMSDIAERSCGGSHDRQQRAGAVFLHLHRDVEHLERAGRVQPIHGDAEQLRVHVVDLAFDDDDPFAGIASVRLKPDAT